MSGWDSYVDSLIEHGQTHMDKACIIGLDGGKWTSDSHAKSLKVTPAEACEVAKCFKSNNFSSLETNGLHIEGEKYQFLRADGDVVLAKKKDKGAITCQCSTKGVIIAHTKEGGQQGLSNKAVGTIAEHLKSTDN